MLAFSFCSKAQKLFVLKQNKKGKDTVPNQIKTSESTQIPDKGA